jgi:polyisoprenoid-binding protein YceI
VIDAGTSRLTVRGYAGGMLKGLGHDPVLEVREFTGNAHFDPETPEQAAVRLAIKAASLEVQNNASDKDRREMKRVMDEEILEVAEYPEILFVSDKVTVGTGGTFVRAQIQGVLALHGVRRPLTIAAQVIRAADSLRANGEFAILQTDYRIKLASVAGGALKLKDELKFAFDIAARQKA